ncbi:MAG: hypothetical protein A4E35_02058 [Methanoregula sp. PtaU1.Bin051]|nr:MAG: hypothetical protein A4E35_02058 [Methanoregula sp. PtaU1.Bin051]
MFPDVTGHRQGDFPAVMEKGGGGGTPLLASAIPPHLRYPFTPLVFGTNHPLRNNSPTRAGGSTPPSGPRVGTPAPSGQGYPPPPRLGVTGTMTGPPPHGGRGGGTPFLAVFGLRRRAQLLNRHFQCKTGGYPCSGGGGYPPAHFDRGHPPTPMGEGQACSGWHPPLMAGGGESATPEEWQAGEDSETIFDLPPQTQWGGHISDPPWPIPGRPAPPEFTSQYHPGTGCLTGVSYETSPCLGHPPSTGFF